MDLRVVDVMMNKMHNGFSTQKQIETQLECNDKCKKQLGLGNGVCYGTCYKCIGTLMVNLKQRDEDAEEEEGYIPEDERDCDNCNGENCGDCEEHDEWEHE